MTRHRLVRCQPEQLLAHVSRRHASSRAHRGLSPDPGAVPGWLEPNERRVRIAWQHQLPGCLLSCCLVIEPGANGVLAHLSAEPLDRRGPSLPEPVSRLASEVWAAHELAAMARGAETDYEKHGETESGTHSETGTGLGPR